MPFPNRDTQFKPGQSGNPSGRPRGQSLGAKLREFLDGEDDGIKRRDLLIEKLFYHALKGDARLIKIIFERADGRTAGNIDEADAIAQLQAELTELRRLYHPQDAHDCNDPAPGNQAGDPPAP